MVARLLQAAMLGWVATAILAGAMLWTAGYPTLALCAAPLIGGGYSLVLALEFLLLARANRNNVVPRATARQLFAAWIHETRSAPAVFCWRQPFLSDRWANHLVDGNSDKRGLLLIHGFLCNRGLWNHWMQRLRAVGVPHIAVNLEPVFGSIDDYAVIIERAVQRLEGATKLPPVIVAHSMGGLAVRRWLADQPDMGRAHHVVTMGSPHSGTGLARFALTTNTRQMSRHGAWLQALAKRESARSMHNFTCFYSNCDNIVFPASTAMLAGAENRHLAGVAHVHMVERREPFEETMRWLEGPASAG